MPQAELTKTFVAKKLSLDPQDIDSIIFVQDVLKSRCKRHINTLRQIGVVLRRSTTLEWVHYAQLSSNFDIYRLHRRNNQEPIEPIIDVVFNERERLHSFQTRQIIPSPAFELDYGGLVPLEAVLVLALTKPNQSNS